MRGLLRTLIISDPELVSMIPEDNWFGSGGVGVSPELRDRPSMPFAEIRFGGTFPGMAQVTRVRCEIWVHEEQGSYNLINTVIRRLKVVLGDAVQVDFEDTETGEKSHLVQTEWSSDSPDLYDTGYRSNTRSTGFDLVGTGF